MLGDVHSEVEIDYSESNAPDACIYHGHAACRAFVRGRYQDWEERSFDAVELINAPPDAVIAVGRMRGKGRASEVKVEAHIVTVWTLCDGKISRIKLYQTRADALKAVGSEGWPVPANLVLVRSIYEAWERGDYSSTEGLTPTSSLRSRMDRHLAGGRGWPGWQRAGATG